MENIAKKIEALNYSDESMAILPKFLGTLAAKDPQTGEDLVTVQDIVQILDYLKGKGISLRPSQIKVFALGFSYIQKAVEEMDKIGELKIYVDDPTRMIRPNPLDNVNRILFLRSKNVTYKTPEGKYSKLAYSKRAFEAEYGVLDLETIKSNDESLKADKHLHEPKPEVAEAKQGGSKASADNVDTKVEAKAAEPKEAIVGDAISEAKQHNGKKEIDPQPMKKSNDDRHHEDKANNTVPILEEMQQDKIKIVGNNDGVEVPKDKLEESPKRDQNKKNDGVKSNKPKNIRPVAPFNPQAKDGSAKSRRTNLSDKDLNIPAPGMNDVAVEYTGELDLAGLEASFNNHKNSAKEDELVSKTTVNVVSGSINVYNTPYDEILSKPQTIALTDETFERYERLSDSIRRVLTTVYNMTEITESITDNLIKLVTAGVPSDKDVIYYAITYGKNISEEEAQHLKTSIEEELEYIKIFDLDTEGQGRAA